MYPSESPFDSLRMPQGFDALDSRLVAVLNELSAFLALVNRTDPPSALLKPTGFDIFPPPSLSFFLHLQQPDTRKILHSTRSTRFTGSISMSDTRTIWDSLPDFSAEECAVASRVEAEHLSSSSAMNGTSTPVASPRKRLIRTTTHASDSIRRVAEERAVLDAASETHARSPGPFENPTTSHAFAGAHYAYNFPAYQSGSHYPPPMPPVMPPTMPPAYLPPPQPAVATPLAPSPAVPAETSQRSPETVESSDGVNATEPAARPMSPAQKSLKVSKNSGGRPSQDAMRKLEDLSAEFQEKAQKLADDTGLTLAYTLDFITKGVKNQRDVNTWNKFQPFALDEENFETEVVARLARSKQHKYISGPVSTDQLKTAYWDFMEEHGEEEAKTILALWHSVHEVETAQTKGARKRTFTAAVNQLLSLAKSLRNKHQIHMFCLVTGGIISSDQALSHIIQIGESEGFASSGFLFNDEALLSLFKAYISQGVATTFTNTQLATIARERGLTITGKGIEDAETVQAFTTKVAIGSSSTNVKGAASNVATAKASKDTPKSKDKGDVLVAVKTRLAETVGRFSKKGNTLYWSTIADQCLQDGIQITGYPSGARYPWSLLTLPASERSRGIKSMSKEDQELIVSACNEPQGSEFLLTFVKVTNADLAHGRLPILVTAPDENGVKTEVYRDDIPGLVDAPKRSKGSKPTVQTKTEEMEVDINMTPTSSASRVVRSRGKDRAAEDEEVDELSVSSSDAEEHEVTPRAKIAGRRKQNQGSRSKICSREIIEDSDDMLEDQPTRAQPTRAQPPRSVNTTVTSTAADTVKPSPGPQNERPSSFRKPVPQDPQTTVPVAAATTTLKPKPAPLQNLTMDLLKDADFQPLNVAAKRSALVVEGPASAKKAKHSPSPVPSAPPPSPLLAPPSVPAAQTSPFMRHLHQLPPPQGPTPTSAFHHSPSPGAAGFDPPPGYPQPHQSAFTHPSYWQYPPYLQPQPYPHPQNPSAPPPAANTNPPVHGGYMPPMLPPWASMTPEQQAKMNEFYRSLSAQPPAGGSGQPR
ncbi:hypothetical protein PQX77_009564 [Marasmius sp. AFHP31]|nr:hypothetical protein PQX77_009564 [Marasmius sp. AFHP31]